VQNFNYKKSLIILGNTRWPSA